MNNNLNQNHTAKVKNISAMLIYGTIGIFVKNIPLSSSLIAFFRGVIGVLFLLLIVRLKKDRLNFTAIKNNMKILLISGAFIGFNWILLFEAYNYTTVSVATLCYYMQPVFVTLISPMVLSEKLTPVKTIAVFISLIGMAFVSGVVNISSLSIKEFRGIFLGLGAAVLYSCVVLLNKKLKNISAYDMTIMQLSAAALTILPYILLTEDLSAISLNLSNTIMLIILGVVHTGFAYALYFDSLRSLSAQSAAIFSYVDPVSAIILSSIILNESMDIYGIIGAVLILGSTMLSEIYPMVASKKSCK